MLTWRVGFVFLLGVLPLAADQKEVFEKLARLIEAERQKHQIPLIALALVDGERTVFEHASGAGGPRTLYRVGSVSKLFTTLALLQFVERGAADLDEPIARYLPEFKPQDPFHRKITLRHLLSHRSGLVREPPVGNYFDMRPATLEQTVESLNRTELVYEPGRRTKYSNAAFAVVGRVVEKLAGKPFDAHIRHAVLEPLGMRHSGFRLWADPEITLAQAWMWTYDGRRFQAPWFEPGIAPAANLYATTADLARFLAALLGGGRPVVGAATLAKAFEPQFGGPYGLGFLLGRLNGVRAISHSGAIYGFATELMALPEARLGVVVIATRDCANLVTARIAQQALRWMLAARRNRDLDDVASPVDISEQDARPAVGIYGEGEEAVALEWRNGALYLTPLRGGNRLRVRRLDQEWVTDDVHGAGQRLQVSPQGLIIGGRLLPRRPDEKPAPAPHRLTPYIGEYGWDHNVLYILEWRGRLYALIEWFDYYPLEQVRTAVFRFPDFGLYAGEPLLFTPEGASVGGVLFPKRASGAGSAHFRIQPQRPVEQLRQEALAATPPREQGDFYKPDLVELARLDPTIRLDIRYATPFNFLGTPVYKQARAFLQRPAAEALLRAHRELKKLGYGLLIHDAYRPWHITKLFWDATPPDKRIFVADPADGSRHNRGCAVDLTLYELATGRLVDMPGLYDEMTERSYPEFPGGTTLQRWLRDLLRRHMEGQGFRVFPHEWWHFDYQGWQKYPILNTPIEAIPGASENAYRAAPVARLRRR